jgi:hypothetical protein
MYSMLIETVTAEFCSVVALQLPDASLQIQWKISPQIYFLPGQPLLSGDDITIKI